MKVMKMAFSKQRSRPFGKPPPLPLVLAAALLFITPAAHAGIFSDAAKHDAMLDKRVAQHMQTVSGNTYRGYQQRADKNSIAAKEKYFEEQRLKIEKQEQAVLQARQAQIEKRIENMLEKQAKLVKEIEEADIAASQARIEDTEQTLAEFEEQAVKRREESERRDAARANSEESEKVRRIYKQPESSPEEPSRVFKNFR